MFIDEININIHAGDGGRGAATFRTEKHVPRGGPDGGDGGRGGSVWLETDANISTLLDFRPGKNYRADRGMDGMGKQQFGKDGKDLVLRVPPGTQAFHAITGQLIADLAGHPMKVEIARGGRGGKGNIHFVSSVQQAPKFAELGEPGETFPVRLELKLLADVGLVGYPNVGKSTLLSVVSAARPKIADYPFTTLVPNLGVVALDHSRSFVIADVPGLIERASEGAGLGIQFLKHLERTRLLIHLIDISGYSGRDPKEDYAIIRTELASFSAELAALPEIIVLSRADLVFDEDYKQELLDYYREISPETLIISAPTRLGLDELMKLVWARLESLPKQLPVATGTVRITTRDKDNDDPRQFVIDYDEKTRTYTITGHGIERRVAMTDMSNDFMVRRLQRSMERWGLFKKLKEAGAEDGDNIRIRHLEFDYVDDDLIDEPVASDDDDDMDEPV
jgi:GTP-binding protein